MVGIVAGMATPVPEQASVTNKIIRQKDNICFMESVFLHGWEMTFIISVAAIQILA